MIVTALLIGAMPTTSGAQPSLIPGSHHLVHHGFRKSGVVTSTQHKPLAAQPERGLNSRFSGMTAKAVQPSAEWDCGGGDAGCSWEPYGWRHMGD